MHIHTPARCVAQLQTPGPDLFKLFRNSPIEFWEMLDGSIIAIQARHPLVMREADGRHGLREPAGERRLADAEKPVDQVSCRHPGTLSSGPCSANRGFKIGALLKISRADLPHVISYPVVRIGRELLLEHITEAHGLIKRRCAPLGLVRVVGVQCGHEEIFGSSCAGRLRRSPNERPADTLSVPAGVTAIQKISALIGLGLFSSSRPHGF